MLYYKPGILYTYSYASFPRYYLARINTGNIVKTEQLISVKSEMHSSLEEQERRVLQHF